MQNFRGNNPNWKPLYEAVLFETDASKLPDKISVARKAIFNRLEESLTLPIPSEHRAMDEAPATCEDLQRRPRHQRQREIVTKKGGSMELAIFIIVLFVIGSIIPARHGIPHIR